MSVDKRGYRRGVRVIVTKGDKIVLGTRYDEDGKTVDYHLFPGGGVEQGESFEQATIKEVKEEVGMLVKNPQQIGYCVTYEKEFPQPERRKLYRGGEDTWMTAEYVRPDNTLHGKEGDSFAFEWVTVDEAIAKFSVFTEGKHYEANQSKIQGLLVFKEFVAKRKRDVSLESYRTTSLPTW